jgi:DNA-directed RNA polymerase subunit RPC12/RpoP
MAFNQSQNGPEDAPEAPLLSKCQGCGGAVPVVLGQPDAVCPYCGQTGLLSTEVARQVRLLGEKLKAREARENQFVSKQIKLIQANPLSLLVPMMILWVFIGGWLLFAFKPPPEIGFMSFLFETRQPAEEFDMVTASWWLYWSIAVGVGLTATIKGAAQISLRRLVEFSLPIQPISKERPPRCRRCGAELTSKGAVRRCNYCQADHLVIGARYQRLEKSLDKALNQRRNVWRKHWPKKRSDPIAP